MLRAREEIAAGLGGRLDVGPGPEIAVGEPGVAAPVLRRRIGVEDLRHAAECALPVEQPGPAPRVRLRLRLVGEWEAMPEARSRLHRGLPVAVIELAAPPARDVGEHSVEHLVASFVAVESGVQEGPQEAPALRDPFRDHMIDAAKSRRLLAAACPDREIAHRQQPGSDHRAFGRGIDEVVDAAGFEAA